MPERMPIHDGGGRDDMLAEIAFEPIDRREFRRSGVTKPAETQRPRNYALLAVRVPVGARKGIEFSL